MKHTKYFLLTMAMFFSACAGKNVSTNQSAFRTVGKLRVGMVELSSHDFNISSFENCMKNYPATGLLFDNQTRRELQGLGWSSENLISSLQKKDFPTYENINNFSLLLMFFKNKEQKSFIRLVNFVSKEVRTLSFTPAQLTCENVLAASRTLVIDSIPPYADVYLNDQMIGETPVWTSLQDGTYDIQCKLPDDTFPKKSLTIPGTVQYLCKRDNQHMQSMESNGDSNATFNEKSQSVILYGFVGLASLASTIIPYLLLK